ncbi:MAG: DUF1566 domain-containing protein [Sinobacterium sp.]|nr:DUF1566 domain-containing protein [Sinobacterium sp.]
MRIITMKKALLLSVLSVASGALFAADCLTQHEMDNPDHMYSIVDADTSQTVQDLETNLTWTRCPLGQSVQAGLCADEVAVPMKTYTWEESLAAAETANLAVYEGSADWRVPSIKELQTIMAPTCKNRAMNELAFPTAANAYIYTSTPDVKSVNNVLIVKMSDGQLLSHNKTSARLVYLVSGVNP